MLLVKQWVGLKDFYLLTPLFDQVTHSVSMAFIIAQNRKNGHGIMENSNGPKKLLKDGVSGVANELHC